MCAEWMIWVTISLLQPHVERSQGPGILCAFSPPPFSFSPQRHVSDLTPRLFVSRVPHDVRRTTALRRCLSGMGPDLPRWGQLHLPYLFVVTSSLISFLVTLNSLPCSLLFFISFPQGLALLRTLEHRLYDPDASELLAVLSGRSHIIPAPTSPSASSSSRKLLKAEMVTREVSLSGGEGERGGGGGVYGVEEGRLFRELEEGKWKEGGFERLVRRELDSI